MIQTSKFSIQGMTCENCEKTIKEKLLALPEVMSVKVSRDTNSAEIEAHRRINPKEVKKALADLPKYKVLETNEKPEEAQVSWLITYKPLLIVFAFIFILSTAAQLKLTAFDAHLFMNHLMAGFFIGLSLFKFLDLKAFAESFSSYDPLAQRWLGYGYVYPFIEFALGLLFITGLALPIANVLTIVVLGISTLGVYKRLQSKSAFQCACLGTAFNLPLSWVTVSENVAMIVMAAIGLLS
jgi:copper chaperone CopZ